MPVSLAQTEQLAISVVIVSWNVCPLLRQCLASLQAAWERLSLDVWVVDNASTDDSVAMVGAEYPWVKVVTNRENRGFAAANNQALRLSEGRYVLLLNADAALNDGALEAMCGYLDRHPNVGVVGPQLLNPNGTVQSSRRRAPRLATGFVESTQLQQWRPRWWLTDRYYVADRTDGVTQPVDWLVGACLLVRRAAIDAAGLLDEGFRMYSEELEWCLRMGRAGWAVVYLPSARVTHHYGQSSGQDVLARHLNYHASKYRLHDMLYGRPAALLLRCWIAGLYLLQFSQELAKLAVIRRNRPLRRNRLRMLADVLLWHVRSAGETVR